MLIFIIESYMKYMIERYAIKMCHKRQKFIVDKLNANSDDDDNDDDDNES